MFSIPPETMTAYDRRMERAGIPAEQQADYRKWVRFYLDFCRKYGHSTRDAASIGPFFEKLASKGQSEARCEQASGAVKLLLRRGAPSCTPVEPQETHRAPSNSAQKSSLGVAASWEREFEALRGAIRMRNYSGRTHEAYRHWVSRFQAFMRSKAAEDLGAEDVKAFLTDLAVAQGVWRARRRMIRSSHSLTLSGQPAASLSRASFDSRWQRTEGSDGAFAEAPAA